MRIISVAAGALRKLGTLFGAVAVGGAIFAVLAIGLVPVWGETWAAGDFWLDAESNPLELPPLSEPSLVFAADGAFLAKFRAEVDREPVPLERVPMHVRQAVMAAEDATFYEHSGVDIHSIGRAFLSNFEAGDISQGGSTITQQVIKNAYFIDKEAGVARQTLDRKVREAFMAVRLEDHMTKDEILDRYLNTVYFGGGAYGIQAAARRYFNVNVEELGIASAAMLAGMVASPGKFDPVLHPTEAHGRRGWVLDRLAELGWIDQAQHDAAAAEPLPPARFDLPQNQESLYFVEAVKQELLNGDILPTSTQDPEQAKVERRNIVFKGGLRIKTTLDPRLQHLAETTVRDAIDGRSYSAALVSLDPGSGAIRAVFGGEDFHQEQFNLAMQGRRNGGSTMKVFAVVALLERGYSPNDTWGGPGSCIYRQENGKPWPGKNSVTGSSRTGTLHSQLVNSVNCAFVNIVNRIRPEAIVDAATKMGVDRAKLAEVPAIVLGGSSVSPLDMAAGFSTLSSGGVRHKPFLIESITNSAGQEIYKATPTAEQAIDPNIAWTTIAMMKDVLTSGTAKGRGIGRPAAGKTGTTTNNADAWFIGMTPQLVTAVWTGDPDRVRPGAVRFGGSTAAPIWQSFMEPAHEGWPEQDWPEPDYGAYGRPRSFDASGSAPRRSKSGGGGGGGGSPQVVDGGPVVVPAGD